MTAKPHNSFFGQTAEDCFAAIGCRMCSDAIEADRVRKLRQGIIRQHTQPQTERDRIRQQFISYIRTEIHQDVSDKVRAIRDGQKSITERWLDYHEQNPHVLDQMIEIARELKQQYGFEKASISLITERLRWLTATKTKGDDPFGISQDYRSRYARLIMATCPDLKGMFNLRPITTW